MTPSQKPEWIETAKKKTSSFPRSISRGLPVIALVVSTSILGVGAIFADSAEESPVKAVEFSAPVEFDPSATSTAASIEIPLIDTSLTFSEEDDEVLGYEDDLEVLGYEDDLEDLDEDEGDDEDEDDESDEDEGDEDEGDDD
ncbi:MAG: hypothetical protein Q7R42_02880 [Candidatus Planktophila sp.]|nr:hypothetical protein [Candidatus Planktophila sp.]